MSKEKSFFVKRQKMLGCALTAYVALLLLSHWQISAVHVWVVAAVFSIAMNFTYLSEALSLRKFATTEALVAIALVGASLLGLFVSPLLVIAAIFGHGCWDLAKHFGSGVPFYFWYTCSCFLIDTVYSFSLLLYWMHIN